MGAGTRGDAALQLTGQLMNPLLKPQEKRAMRLGTADVGTCGNAILVYLESFCRFPSMTPAQLGT